MKQQTYADAIRKIRSERGITQASMANLIEVSDRYYQKLEAGESEPSLETLQKTLDNLKIKFEELFPNTDPKAPDFTAAASFLSKFGTLKPDLQKIVLAIVHGDLDYAKDLSPEFLKKCEPLLKAL